MKKHNYITQEQLNNCLAAFFTSNGTDFHHFFTVWANSNLTLPSTLKRVNQDTVLTPAQHAFVGNVLTIFNNV